MSAIRMECDKSITVLINPLRDKNINFSEFNEKTDIVKGVFLTRSYENPSGVLPEEHIFISNDEQWFYWLGYNKDFEKVIPDTEENNNIIEKIFDYFNEFSSGNQIDIALKEHCNRCNKQGTLYCEINCSYGAV